MNPRTSTRPESSGYVSYREFDRTIGDLQDDISEIKSDVKSLLGVYSEGKGAAGMRKVLFTAMLALVSAGWWLPDLLHRH